MQCPFDDILRNRERIGWMQRPFDDVLRNHQQGRRGSLLAVRRNFDENLGYAGSSGYGAVVRKSASGTISGSSDILYLEVVICDAEGLEGITIRPSSRKP